MTNSTDSSATAAPASLAFIGGTGEEGMGLAYRFAMAGHVCAIGSRAIEKAEGAVAELREKDAALPLVAATNADAVAQSELIVITTPYTAQADTLPPLAAACAGKIVISTVVPRSFKCLMMSKISFVICGS